MGKIRILPEILVNQIAAGEVIERPASVVRELVDNSIDADANRIEIEMRGSGRELIRVTDDGTGLSRDDMLLAFERHATSKLQEASGLFQISSLGFRGEALPSISSVSEVEFISRERGSARGHRLRIVGGEMMEEEAVAAAEGTTIKVHSLFFNTPARAKFLKADATELAQIVRTVKTYALAYESIAWNLKHEESLSYKWPAGTFEARLADVFGADFNEKVMSVDHTLPEIRVRGVLGRSELNRRSRGEQYLYVNQRPIQSAALIGAIRGALGEWLDSGEWPFFVLFIEIDPRLVDVNVHPAKREVRFADERRVNAAIVSALRAALPKHASPLAEWTRSSSEGATTIPPNVLDAGPLLTGAGWRSAPGEALSDSPAQRVATQVSEPTQPKMRAQIYQVHLKYLIAPISSGLVIIDQHAAHERILYERAMRSFDSRQFASQRLLFPFMLDLTPEEDATFREMRGDLHALGFELSDFGPRNYAVEAVPAGLKRASELSMLKEMVAEYEEFRRARLAPREAMCASFACKAAIRTGDELSGEEMAALVDELFATAQPNSCPHGRPTFVEIKLSELDRRFKRIE
ncbi:DNA mismatch repair endonuclease MutL [bacterium]|nr:DNA mismatch repair endonuclease MutL [bacterium]